MTQIFCTSGVSRVFENLQTLPCADWYEVQQYGRLTIENLHIDAIILVIQNLGHFLIHQRHDVTFLVAHNSIILYKRHIMLST